MKKQMKQFLAGTLAGVLLLGTVTVPSAEAAKKKPKLSKKKITVSVKKTKKLKIKNTKGIKKTTWSVKSKKIAKLSKKKKTSVVIKGVKNGKTTVTAKVKVKKKVYKLKCKVTVQKKGRTVPSAKPSDKPSTKPSIKPTGASTTAPSIQPSAAPSSVPSNAPSTAPSTEPSTAPSTAPSVSPSSAPTPEPTPIVPEGSRYEVKALESNQWTAIGEEYYSGLVFDAEEGSAFYKKPKGGAKGDGTVGFLLNEQGKAVDVSDFDTLEIKLEAASGANASKVYYTNARFYMGGAEGYTDGIGGISMGYPSERLRTYEMPLSALVAKGISLNNLKAVSISPTSTTDMGEYGIKIYSFTFVKKEGEEYVSKDTPVAIKASTQDGRTSHMLKETQTVQLKAEITNKNKEVINHKVTWSSSDETIATVAADGTVTGIKAGSVDITATADGYDDVTSTVGVDVYDDTPKSVSVRTGDWDYAYVTLDELKTGIQVKNLLLNENEEVVGEAEDQEVTITSSNSVTAEIENGMLKATEMSSTRGTIRLQAANKGELRAVTKTIYVYAVGFHVPITAANVYCASEGKTASNIVINENTAMVKDLNGSNSAIAFKCNLPAGKTIADYDGVNFQAFCQNAGTGSVMTSLFMPKNGWDTDILAPTDKEEWANAKSACKSGNSLTKSGGSASFQFNDVTEQEKTSNKVNFAMKFGLQDKGDIGITEIFIFKY